MSSQGQDWAHALHYITVSPRVFVALSRPAGQSPHRQGGMSCFFECIALISRRVVAAANSSTPTQLMHLAGH